MTGFATVSRETAAEVVHVTIKSVNHRFLDVIIKAPATLAALENRLRAVVQQRVGRGRVELTVLTEETVPSEKEVVLDERLLDQISAAIASARARGLVSGGLTASDLLRIPHALEIRLPDNGRPSATPGASLTELVGATVAEALDALVQMRDTEGRFIGADLDERLSALDRLVAAIEGEARDGQKDLEGRLRERLSGLPVDLQGDHTAVARELVRFVARSDIDEEIVRLRSHVEHWRQLAAASEPCGRKLDFLVQEMNREVNTIGSKVESARTSEMVVAAKAELERIREQVQNVE